jgi:Tfp pilus assembly protein PilF
MTRIDSKKKVSALLSAAVTLQQVGETRRAIDLLEEASRLDPGNHLVHVSLGLAHQEDDNVELAEKSYRQALQLQPENLEVIKALGMFMVSQSRPQEGLVWLREYHNRRPEDIQVLDALTNALIEMKQRDELQAVLESAWQTSQDVEVGLRLVRFLFTNSKFKQAREMIEQVRGIKETPQVLAELAFSQSIDKQFDVAEKTLLRAIEIDPGFDRAWRGLAQTYTRLGKKEKAIEAAERSLSLNPGHYRNWLAKADALMAAQQFTSALAAIQSGMDLIQKDDPEAEPSLVRFYLLRSYALLLSGKLDDCLVTLSQARQKFPHESRFYSLAVQVLQESHRLEEAMNVLGEAQSAGIDASLMPLRFMLLHQMGQPEQAWESVKDQFATRKQERVNILASIGVQLYLQGHILAARQIFEQLHDYSPEDVRIATNLAYILIGEADFDQAKSLLTQVIEREDRDFSLVARCNLGYLHIWQDQLEQAFLEFETVLKQAAPESGAILRVAFFWQGTFCPDYAPHSVREVSLANAARANLAAIALAQTDFNRAEQEVQAIASSGAELLTSQVNACLLLAKKQAAQSKRVIQKSLDLVEHPAEAQMLETWLASIKNG